MRRTRNQDKYITFILSHQLLTPSQKIWLTYWFLDQNGYPRCLATTERELGQSSGNTDTRIIQPLKDLNILKKIGSKQLGVNRETPIFDFTHDFEMQVAEFCRDPKGYWLDEEFTRPFDEERLPANEHASPVDLNNKGIKKTKKQENGELSPHDYQKKYPEVNPSLIELGKSENEMSPDPKFNHLITR